MFLENSIENTWKPGERASLLVPEEFRKLSYIVTIKRKGAE